MTTTLIQPLQPAGSSACREYFNPATKVMALDTIKTSKNHKTFPFTSPTITTHKNPPTGALILEIIFSSDDVSPGTIQGEEGDTEEGDNSGDSDGEDDVDGADIRTHGHHSGNDIGSDGDDDDEDDEEEEDEEDDEDEEGVEESDDEDDDDDGEHELDDEDFGNDFEEDLIIDFGNQNEDDQLVVEFEDTNISNSPPNSPPPQKAASPANPVPFWFTNEEQGKACALYMQLVLTDVLDQIRMIFESYALTLNLEEQRKACVRSPAVCLLSLIDTVFVFM